MKARLKTPETIVEYGQWFIDSDTDTDPVSLEVNPMTNEKFGMLHTHTSQLRVNDGDYIVKAADGSLTACNPADFAEKYEPLDLADRVNEPKKLKAKASE